MLREGAGDGASEVLDAIRVAGHQGAELVAADSVPASLSRNGFREPAGQPHQKRVPGAVAEGVVELLEPVQVVEEQVQGLLARRSGQPLMEVGREPAAVAQPGEGIGDRLLAAEIQEAASSSWATTWRESAARASVWSSLNVLGTVSSVQSVPSA